MLRKWSAFVLVLLAMPVLAHAQNTGKIVGRVIDGSSGEGLPGAAVVISSTMLGTATDVDGNFYIIGVPVGSYSVQALFVGYQTETMAGVSISTGYTQELNFTLQPGIELDEIVVQYERPLIQKDAIGVPKIVNAAEILVLPVRGVAAVAKIQAGVVSKEGSGTLNIRGGRGSEVTYYIDGVKGGSTGVPQSAIQEQEMVIGSINARYGDAMSGIINITTKSGSPNFFGSLEGVTSSQLDDFGYNLGSATLGGPIISNKLSFFASAEFRTNGDYDPRSILTAQLTDAQLDDLRQAPAGFLVTDADGNESIVPLPRGLESGATLAVDNGGALDLSGGGLTFSDGTILSIPEGASVALNPISRAEQLGPEEFEYGLRKRARNNETLALAGNLTWNLFKNARLRLGGRRNSGEYDSISTLQETFAPEMARAVTYSNFQTYATWTQYLSHSTFYQLQVDISGGENEVYDPRFGTGFDDFLNYGDIDNPIHAALKGYKNLVFTEEMRIDDHGNDDPADDTEITVKVPQYVDRYEDGISISSETTAGLVSLVGGRANRYEKSRSTQFRLQASATTQLGLNQIEFGAEYEQDSRRYWRVDASTLARFVADGDPEQIADDDPDLDPAGYSKFSDLPSHLLDGYVFYYGYDVRGQDFVDSEDFNKFLNTEKGKPDVDYNIAPYEPIYYGGYIQDKIEFRDIVLNLGLRLDVFDNNQRVFKDKYARRPIVRAGAAGVSLPTGIGNDYAVYFSGDDVVGFRDLVGNFYDAAGQPAGAGAILLNGLVRLTDSRITQDMFEDYEPQVSLMPRIGVSFPVTDQALFFASYGIVSQRPSRSNFASINVLKGTGGGADGRNNNNLLPETTTKYELGFRQRLGARQALTISGFFHQINNLIQVRNLRDASPSGYARFENVDFGTVKGLEFGYDLRRTEGVAMNANYTLSFASGTGSSANTTGTIVWIDETPPNFISPLDFDQRHKLNISLDYRLGADEGPTILGSQLLANFGVNILATAGSGFPYTGIIDPIPVNASRAPLPSGAINNDRMPWTNRVDIRVDRRFRVGADASVTAFLWVQNLLDTQNTQGVYRYTGLPDDDGFLATVGGAQFIESAVPASETLYRHRNRQLGWVGLPRLTRLGVRLDF